MEPEDNNQKNSPEASEAVSEESVEIAQLQKDL